MTVQETESVSLDESLAEALEAVEPQGSEEEVIEETTEEVTEEVAPEVDDGDIEIPPMLEKRFRDAIESWGAKDENGNLVYPNGRDIQRIVLDLYKDRQGYATKVEQERAVERKRAEQLQGYASQWNQVLAPYQQMITESGATPDTFVRQAMGMAQALKRDPQGTLMRLAQSTGVDLRKVMEGQDWVSPEAKEIQALRSEMQQRDRREQAERQRYMHMQAQHLRAENAKQIQTFMEATDDSGNPLHPHLEAVQGTMAQLIHGREAQRRTDRSIPRMELQEAYDQACLLNPEVQGAIHKEQEKQEAARKAAEAKKATEAARRPKAGSSGKSKPKLDLDQEIDKAIQNAA